MDKVYNFELFESKIKQLWMEHKAFAPTDAKETFVVVIPPPNVTGVLHMGHALNNNIQDILVRYNRMQGKSTLWVPGSDHAGIATQQVVERSLANEGVTRQSLGRENFIERTWLLAQDHKSTIVNQLHRMGTSFDWDYERFTLDQGLSDAVKEVFVYLYEKGLIYRGDYLVNWSVDAGTALSDEEVIYKEVKGHLYHIRYSFVNKNIEDEIIVATTRPETLFGDTAIAVHPSDTRYTKYLGEKVWLPLTNKQIPIIADDSVDPEFGTGVLKITPAHAINDYEVAKRQNLEFVNILNLDGTLNQNVPERYRGLTVIQARTRSVEALKVQKLMVKIEDIIHKVGHCYRTDCIVEPLFSKQWFVRMDSMAKKALHALKQDEIRFYPKHWANTYTHWLENIRDWCISRQLWWGHRIPVWYNDETGEMIVSRDDPSKDPKYAGQKLRQDGDVLDTWFSSWLWPFSVFGWPKETKDLIKFYPTTTLVTAYDIIFFWVARMVMAGLEFTGQVPFRDIYIHGLIRDEKGRKMSKSLGNGIDPIEIIDQHGADALKFTLAFLCKLGGDVLLNRDHFQLGSKFANKVWNASRFLLMNLEQVHYKKINSLVLISVDKWMLSRLQYTITQIEDAIQNYRLDDAARYAYEYFWTDFCDWYVESVKTSLNSNNQEEIQRASSVLLFVLVENLKMLHPFLPFITEEIYQHIYKLVGESLIQDDSGNNKILARSRYPSLNSTFNFPQETAMFSHLKKLVTGIRTLRSEFNLSPKLKIQFTIYIDTQSSNESINENTSQEAEEPSRYFEQQSTVIKNLVGAKQMTIVHRKVCNADSGVGVEGKHYVAMVDIKEIIDIEQELKRLATKIEKLQTQKNTVSQRLSNKHFIEKAKSEYVEEMLTQERELIDTIKQLQEFSTRLS